MIHWDLSIVEARDFVEGSTEIKYGNVRIAMMVLIINFLFQGPNYVWHCDGYDKLKPFGFPIHGCIDGLVSIIYTCAKTMCNTTPNRYSRRMLWLKVGPSNNDPSVIAHHFLSCVEVLNG